MVTAEMFRRLVLVCLCVGVCALCLWCVQVTFNGTLTQVIVAFRSVFDSALAADPRTFSLPTFNPAMGATPVPTTDISLRLLIGAFSVPISLCLCVCICMCLYMRVFGVCVWGGGEGVFSCLCVCGGMCGGAPHS